MNYSQAQNMVTQREMLAQALPEHIEFKERLSGNAEAILRQCGHLSAPSGTVTVQEHFDNVLRVVKKDNPAKATLKALRTAAEDLRKACLGFAPGSEHAVLSSADVVQTHLDAFALAVPNMSTPYYLQPIRNALQQIRLQLAPSPKGAK